MELIISLVCLAAVIAFIYIYKSMTRNFGYWEAQGIPAEKPYPLVGSEFPLFTRPFHEVDTERFKKHGRIYGTYLHTTRILNISDPEIIKMILVKDFHVFVNRQIKRTGIKMMDTGFFSINDDWKRIRSVVSPTFSTGKIKRMVSIIQSIAQRLTESVLEFADKGQPVSIKREFSKFSIEVMGTCTFGIRFDPFKNPNHPFILNSRKLFESNTTFIGFFLLGILPQSFKIIKEMIMKIIGFTYFQDAAEDIIENRRNQTNNNHVDFLQLMLDAKEGKLENTETVEKETDKMNEVSNGGEKKQVPWIKTLDEDEIVTQCTTFLFAGHDAIAMALSYVAFNLARNMEVQDKLIQEVDETWDRNGGIDYDSMNKMTYLNAVISETMRLQSVAVRIQRQAKEEYTIPNTNIVVPKDGLVAIPIYVLHHDPELFPNPDKFDPDRFLPENKDNIVPYSYIPFADGPRNCIAMRFALMEMKFCLAYLLRYVKFCPTAETMKPLEFYNGAGALQCKKVIVRPERRRPTEKSSN